MASPNKEIIGVQYLRGLAALGVVVAHTSGTADFPKYFGSEILGGFLAYGGSGVDLFFVISGFIMCATALKGPQLEPALSAAAFAAKRFTRIIPLMWAAILSYILLRYLGRGIVHPIPYLRALFLFPAGSVEPTQIWTLRHEAIFYTVFCISFLTRKRRLWFMALWFLSPFVYASLNFFQRETALEQSVQIIASPVNIDFAAGVFLGVVWHKWTKTFTFEMGVSPVVVFVGGNGPLDGGRVRSKSLIRFYLDKLSVGVDLWSDRICRRPCSLSRSTTG